jgi:hypothetical protein
MEQWKKIEGYDNYLVSDRGFIRNSKTKISLKSEGYLKGYFSETLQEFYILKSNYISEETYRKIKTSKSFQIPNSNNIEILMEYKNKFNLPNTPMLIENQIGNGLEIK